MKIIAIDGLFRASINDFYSTRSFLLNEKLIYSQKVTLQCYIIACVAADDY